MCNSLEKLCTKFGPSSFEVLGYFVRNTSHLIYELFCTKYKLCTKLVVTSYEVRPTLSEDTVEAHSCVDKTCKQLTKTFGSKRPAFD